jgi:hypothetical protein
LSDQVSHPYIFCVPKINSKLHMRGSSCKFPFGKTCPLIWVSTGFRPTDTGRCGRTISLVIGCVRQCGAVSPSEFPRPALPRGALSSWRRVLHTASLSDSARCLPRGQARFDHSRTGLPAVCPSLSRLYCPLCGSEVRLSSKHN